MKTKSYFVNAIAIALFIGFACLVAFQPALAVVVSDKAKSVVDTIVKPAILIIGVATGAIYTLVGGLKYASAHAEGEGPAMHKAINMLGAGIAIIAISILISQLALDPVLSLMDQ